MLLRSLQDERKQPLQRAAAPFRIVILSRSEGSAFSFVFAFVLGFEDSD